jgi:hypothetical protein
LGVDPGAAIPIAFCKEMKIAILTSTLLGGLLGASITYTILAYASEPSVKKLELIDEQNTHNDDAEENSVDPFAQRDDEPDDHYRFLLTDPTDLTQRDMCVALWYAYQNQTNDILAETTGHEFGLVGNRRSPVEILEEQLDFWRDFQAESARLELEQNLDRTNESKKQNKSEMATPRKPSD